MGWLVSCAFIGRGARLYARPAPLAGRATIEEIMAEVERRTVPDAMPIDEDMPAEVDFSKGVRGLHHILPKAKVYPQASIGRP